MSSCEPRFKRLPAREFLAVVADARGAAASAERRSFVQTCAGLGVPDRRRGTA
jgi:hypothetical protein